MSVRATVFEVTQQTTPDKASTQQVPSHKKRHRAGTI
jgi:hypothetical protein